MNGLIKTTTVPSLDVAALVSVHFGLPSVQLFYERCEDAAGFFFFAAEEFMEEFMVGPGLGGRHHGWSRKG